MTSRRSAILLLALLASGQRAHAQYAASLDLAGTRVEYDGYLASNAFTIAPSVGNRGPNGAVLANLVATFFESGSVSALVSVEGAGSIARNRRVSLDLRGSAGMSMYGGIPALDLLAGARVSRVSPNAGLWGGVEGGVLTGRSSEGLARVFDVGAWWREGPFSIRASARPTRTHDARFSDIVADANLRAGRLQLGLVAGQRVSSADTLRDEFAALTGHVRVARHVDLAASWGQALPDLLRRTPGARYLSAGIRISTGRAPDAITFRDLPPRPDPGTSSLALMSATRVGDSVVVRIRATGGQRVEIMGDFTDWEPRSLTAVEGGEWRAAFLLAPGVHRYNVRVDGGEWSVPAGAGRMSDDFGGEAAVLVVR